MLRSLGEHASFTIFWIGLQPLVKADDEEQRIIFLGSKFKKMSTN